MASRVQQTSAVNTTFASSVTTPSITTTLGNVLVAVWEGDTVALNGGTITDSRGNAWTRRASVNVAATFELEMWTATVTNAGATTITATDTGAGVDSTIIVEEWSGVTETVDQTKTGTGSGTALDTGAPTTTTNANDVVFAGGVVSGASTTYTAGSGFSNLSQNGSTFSQLAMESKIVSATGVYNGLFTSSASGSWAAAVVILQQTSTLIYNVPPVSIFSPTNPRFKFRKLIQALPYNNALAAVDQTITPTGIASTSTLGVPTVSPGNVNISATGIASSLTIGVPVIDTPYSLTVTGIASTLTIGVPTVSPGSVDIPPTGIASTLTIGVPTVALGGSTQNIAPTGIASTLTIGVPSLTSTVNIQTTGIGSTLTLGAPTVAPGAVNIQTTGIASTLTLGSPTISPGAVNIQTTAISSTLTLGSPTLSPGAVTILPTAIASSLTLGTPTITGGTVSNPTIIIVTDGRIGIPISATLYLMEDGEILVKTGTMIGNLYPLSSTLYYRI